MNRPGIEARERKIRTLEEQTQRLVDDKNEAMNYLANKSRAVNDLVNQVY